MVSCLGDLGDDLESLDLAPDPDEDGDLWRRPESEVVPPWPPENVGVGDRGRSRSRSRRRVSLSSQFHASNSMFLKLSGSSTLATLYGKGMIPFMTAFMADLRRNGDKWREGEEVSYVFTLYRD